MLFAQAVSAFHVIHWHTTFPSVEMNRLLLYTCIDHQQKKSVPCGGRTMTRWWTNSNVNWITKKNLCKQTQKVSFSFLLFSLIEYLSENRLSCAIAAVQIVWTNIEHISQFRPKKAHKIESNTVANTECDRDVFWLSVCKNRRRHRVKR